MAALMLAPVEHGWASEEAQALCLQGSVAVGRRRQIIKAAGRVHHLVERGHREGDRGTKGNSSKGRRCASKRDML